MRKLIFFYIVVCCMLLSACANNPTISFSETNTFGNTMFNYLNHGHSTSQGKWIFFNNLEDDSGIYAQKKNSKNKIQLVSDVTYGSPISVVGDELFYIV